MTGEPDALDLFTQFSLGYAISADLTEDEIRAVPSLIILRVLSNVVYFIGRFVLVLVRPSCVLIVDCVTVTVNYQ